MIVLLSLCHWDLKIPPFFPAAAAKKRAGNSNLVKYRVLENCSNIFFTLDSIKGLWQKRRKISITTFETESLIQVLWGGVETLTRAMCSAHSLLYRAALARVFLRQHNAEALSFALSYSASNSKHRLRPSSKGSAAKQ